MLEDLESRNLLSFIAPRNYDAGVQPRAVATADFNGDGIPDLVTASQSPVSVLLGNGDGSFRDAQTFGTPSFSAGLAVGDFNGDGIPDAAVANQLPDGTVSVALGNGDGSFTPPVSYPTGPNPSRLAVGDVNGDGALDLITLNANGTASVLLGNGDGSFRSPTSFTVDAGASSLAVADVNGDGLLDLVLTVPGGTSSTVVVLQGNGDASFGPPVRYTGIGPGAHSVAAGDLNGDGTLDLVVAYTGSLRPFIPGGVSVLLGNGDGSFRPPVNYAANSLSPGSVALGDFNGDGILDIATANGILLGNGDGTFGAPISYGGSTGEVAVGDFNGDGALDLVVRGSDIRVLLGNGDGTFRRDNDYAVGRSPNPIVVSDLNGDGFLDIVTANFDSADMTVLLNAADWGPAPQGPTRPSGKSSRTADLPHADALRGWQPNESEPSATPEAFAIRTADGTRPPRIPPEGQHLGTAPAAHPQGVSTPRRLPSIRRGDQEDWERFLEEVALR